MSLVRFQPGAPYVSVSKRLKQAVCKTVPFRFVGPNPTRHTIRPLRQVGPSRQPLKLESAVRVCQGSPRTLHRVFTCRGHLTVWQLVATQSRGKTTLTINLTIIVAGAKSLLACEFKSRSLRHMLMWPSGRWQRSRKPPVRNRPKVRILP